ncbi:MAG: DUF2953 domain-containing protein [Lachnospiraceae bacterium]|nr:DUF2953 domain-containing protein [Lachnospiraceae bacterium]
MLHILLTILKIIGILLLVIIGLVLLILACVLFVPIRYGAFIKCSESSGKDLSVRLKVTYLLHIISLSIVYKDKVIDKELKIFGFQTNLLNRGKEKDDSHSDQGDSNSGQKEGTSGKIANLRKKLDVRKKEEDDQIEIVESNFLDRTSGWFGDGVTPHHEENTVHEENIAHEDSTADEENNAHEDDSHKENLFVRVKNKIIQIIHKIKYQFHNICGKIKNVRESIGNLREKAHKLKKKADSYKEFLTHDNTKLTLAFVKGELVKVLKHIRPKKVKGFIRFGLGDAYNTGRVLGIIYAVLRGGRKNFNIYADFDNKVLETDIEIKGRMQIYYFVFIAVRIYLNEEFKKLLQRKKELDSKKI